MARDASQRCTTDVTFANVPVSIDTRIVRRSRIVEVNGAHVFSLDGALKFYNHSFQTVFFANVVTGGEGVCRVEANA